MPAPPNDSLRAAFADAYFRAARAGADMQPASAALEALRSAVGSERDLFALWKHFDEQVGRASERLQPALMRLHARFVRWAIAGEVERLGEVFARDPRAGTAAWLETYGRCLSGTTCRHLLCLALSRVPFPVESFLDPPFDKRERLTHLATLIAQARYGDAYAWFLWLAHHSDIPAAVRVHLLIMVAELQLYAFARPTRAREFLEEAEALSPNDLCVVIGWGEWHLETKTDAGRKEAEQRIRQAVQLAPDVAKGYLAMGDLHVATGNLSAAEDQYRQATLVEPGCVAGYGNLARLYANPDPKWFAEHRDRIPRLHSRLWALEPDTLPGLKIEEGEFWRNNGLIAEARAACTEALALDATRVTAYTGRACAAMEAAMASGATADRRAESLAAARADLKAALGVDAESSEVCWGFIWLASTERNWTEAIEWCERLVRLQPEWESSASLRTAGFRKELHDFPAAEADLRRVLELEPAQRELADAMNTVGEAAYREGSNAEAAERLFQGALNLRGETFDHDFQNRLGNLRYWQDNYNASVDYYRRAIKGQPDNAVYHSNLALAIEGLKTPGRREAELREALSELETAARLDPNKVDYSTRLSMLRCEIDFLVRFGEPALSYKHAGTPIRVELHSSLLPEILKPGSEQLAPEFQSQIEAMRTGVLQRTAVPIPGLLFSELNDPAAAEGAFRIRLFDDRPVLEGRLQRGRKFVAATAGQRTAAGVTDASGESEIGELRGAWLDSPEWGKAEQHGLELLAPTGVLLRSVESQVQRSLADFFGHETVAKLLAESPAPACHELIETPMKLTPFVNWLRERLASGIPQRDIAKAAANFLESTAGRDWGQAAAVPTLESLPPPPSIVFAVARDFAVTRADLEAGLPDHLFERAGLLCPGVQWREDAALPAWSFQITVAEHVSEPFDGLTRDEGTVVASTEEVRARLGPAVTVRTPLEHARVAFVQYLTAHVASLLDEAQVFHRLRLLEATHPALVRCVRAHFDLPRLIAELLTYWKDTRTLVSLPLALETVLSPRLPPQTAD